MKRKFIILLSVISITFCSCEKAISLDELLKKNFGFYICEDKTNIALTFLYNIDKNWQTPNTFCYSKILSEEKSSDRFLLTVEYSNKIIRGEKSICFRDWIYPLKCTVILTPKKLQR